MQGRIDMTSSPSAAGRIVFVGCGAEAGAGTAAPVSARRREVVVAGKRVRTVDIHAHCAVPAALELMGQKLGGPGLRTDLDMKSEVALRLSLMDAQGIDIEALSINPNWYGVADRDQVRRIIDIQNTALAEACAANPDRFVAFASVALQFPDLRRHRLAAPKPLIPMRVRQPLYKRGCARPLTTAAEPPQ